MKDPRTGRIGKQHYPLLVELIAKGLTALQIADRLNLNPETVRKFARKRGYCIRPTDMTMENHPSWAGGTAVDRSGYLLRRVAVEGPYGYLIRAVQKRGYLGTDRNGYAPEHRIVMHDMLGRSILPGEVVDHIDGDIRNNDQSNLRLFASNAEHLRVTLKGRVPKWSEAGKAKFVGRPIDPNSANQKRLARLRQSRSDDQESLSQTGQTPDQT